MQKQLLLSLLILPLLSGCFKAYTPPVEQGNVVSVADVSKLKVGMSKNDVQYLLGLPVMQPTFDDNHWFYVYTYQPKDEGKMTQKHLTLVFNNSGKLSQINK